MGVMFPPEKNTNNAIPDEKYLWNYMLDRMIGFSKEKENNFGVMNVTRFERPLAELIDAAFGNYQAAHYAKDHAERALADRGIKCVFEDGKQYVAISTSHSAIGDLIARSRCGGLDWSPILRRIEGALAPQKSYRIGTGKAPGKATLIPWGNESDQPTLRLVTPPAS